jgi:hypothetical protein
MIEMLLYAKEFKELFNEELEGYSLSLYPYFEEGETLFLFDIIAFEEKNGDILSFSGAKLDLLLSISEVY